MLSICIFILWVRTWHKLLHLEPVANGVLVRGTHTQSLPIPMLHKRSLHCDLCNMVFSSPHQFPFKYKPLLLNRAYKKGLGIICSYEQHLHEFYLMVKATEALYYLQQSPLIYSFICTLSLHFCWVSSLPRFCPYCLSPHSS